MKFWKQDEKTLEQIIFHSARIQNPAQNQAFLDHFLDFPYDLSQVLFIATANNTGNIATAVLDRLEMIEMPSYTDEEKLISGMLCLGESDNGVMLFDEIQKLIKSCHI